MKKLLAKLLIIYLIFSVSSVFDEMNEITISCEGVSEYERKNVKYGDKTNKEQFVEDLSFLVIDKKIKGIEILYTTHGFERSSAYITDKNLEMLGSGKILLFKNKLKVSVDSKEYKKIFRLSLINNSYTGIVERDLYSDKYGTTTVTYNVKSKCQGIQNLMKVM
jgi:hypothetical protein